MARGGHGDGPAPTGVVDAVRALEAVAQRLNAESLRGASLQLANVYGAARWYVHAIDQIAERDDPSHDEVAQLLQKARSWLFDELVATARDPREPLDVAIDDLYDATS